MVSKPNVIAAAQELLGAFLVGHGVTVQVTEVEAYAGAADPASHAYVRTPRSEIMYGPPGHLYVYRIHGHHCANVVTGPDGVGEAVLLRAGRVSDGIAVARNRRGGHRQDRPIPDSALARGPGNLCKALGVTMADLGSDLHDGTPIQLHPAERRARPPISAGPRVGIRRNADVPWRFWVTGEETVSAYRRHPRAGEGSGQNNGR